jgi:hypothetical protein
MRKALLSILALTAAAAVLVLAPPPKAEAAVCSWECGLCGLVCPCETCKGPIPFCVCG